MAIGARRYCQTVLVSFQKVEDNLAALGDLKRERIAQEEAVRSARESQRVLLAQYRAGATTYTSVIAAQLLALIADRALLQLQGRQFAASVALVKALCRSWQASADQVASDVPPSDK